MNGKLTDENRVDIFTAYRYGKTFTLTRKLKYNPRPSEIPEHGGIRRVWGVLAKAHKLCGLSPDFNISFVNKWLGSDLPLKDFMSSVVLADIIQRRLTGHFNNKIIHISTPTNVRDWFHKYVQGSRHVHDDINRQTFKGN